MSDCWCENCKNRAFAEYHLFFSSILSSGLLRILAENDVYEKVQQVQEFYGDFVPINEDFLTLQCRQTLGHDGGGWNELGSKTCLSLRDET